MIKVLPAALDQGSALVQLDPIASEINVDPKTLPQHHGELTGARRSHRAPGRPDLQIEAPGSGSRAPDHVSLRASLDAADTSLVDQRSLPDFAAQALACPIGAETLSGGLASETPPEKGRVPPASCRSDPLSRRYILTLRQRECLSEAQRGQNSKHIAHTLGISVHTVNGHLHDAYGRLGARNRAHAVALAASLGEI